MSRIFISILLLLLLGCSRTLRGNYEYPPLDSPSEKVELNERAKTGLIFLDRVADERPDKYIVIGQKGHAESKGDISKVVAEGLNRAFVQRGYAFSDSAPVIVSGAVKEWVAEVKSGINARAKFTLEVIDPSNRKIYSALYSGNSDYSGSFSNKELNRVLKVAMDEAIAQAANDERLLSLLTSF